MSTPARTIGRIFLGASLVFAGVSHLTVAREEFQAQVPESLPLDPETTVLASDGFGLDTDMKRFVRLFFQPVLVALALWSTREPRR